jgi:hypothetical protein
MQAGFFGLALHVDDLANRILLGGIEAGSGVNGHVLRGKCRQGSEGTEQENYKFAGHLVDHLSVFRGSVDRAFVDHEDTSADCHATEVCLHLNTPTDRYEFRGECSPLPQGNILARNDESGVIEQLCCIF